MHSVLTQLSESAYQKMRKAMVKEVYDSKTLTIADVAKRHKINPSTLWGWCHQDLGPNQMKWLLNQSREIRSKRISKSHVKEHVLVELSPGVKVLKRNPGDNKKARIAAEQARALPEVMGFRSAVNPPTVKPVLHTSDELQPAGTAVIINVDHDGKFLKYEVTGNASVHVFTRSK